MGSFPASNITSLFTVYRLFMVPMQQKKYQTADSSGPVCIENADKLVWQNPLQRTAAAENKFISIPGSLRLTAHCQSMWISFVRGWTQQSLEAVWDGDSLDWKEISASEISERVTSRVQPGSIVLFHNAALHTPEALPGILEALLQEGYTFVPISELILPGAYNTDYTIDHTGRQCPAQ